jgi:HTH-type transcriptional regulator/antitoxin HipB
MKYSPEMIGNLVRQTRKELGVSQKDLALSAGVGLRFIVDLEKGKSTCQLAKVLVVLHTLGIHFHLSTPVARQSLGSTQ